jgi:hypothetical protein
MKKCLITALFLTSLFLCSCSENILGPDPVNTPGSNFEILASDFQNVYPFFEKKGVNWDSLTSVYRKEINSKTTEKELYGVISNLISNLKDGHVRLDTPLGQFHYEEYFRYSHNFPDFSMIQANYLKDTKASLKFVYGKLNDQIGYIYIPVFESNQSEESFKQIDNVLYALKDMKAIIIDIRDNYGGEIENAKTVASRFIASRNLYVYSRWKISSKKGDFSDFSPEYIEPAGESVFRKPVVILSNRRCYSSAEHFIFAMKTSSNVTVIGDTTGGVMGIPVYRELPNGWKYMLPRSIQYDKNKVCYEGKGIPPDITVSNSDNSAHDLILEKAISFLTRKISL